MTDINIAELRAIAKAATPGPWITDIGQGMAFVVAEVRTGRPGGEVIIQCRPTVSRLRDVVPNAANAIYAATFNPEFCLGLLDKLERYEAEPQPGDDLVEWAKNHPLYMWREVSRVEATNARYYDALNARLANCTSCRAPNYCQPCLDILAVLNPTEAKNA